MLNAAHALRFQIITVREKHLTPEEVKQKIIGEYTPPTGSQHLLLQERVAKTRPRFEPYTPETGGGFAAFFNELCSLK